MALLHHTLQVGEETRTLAAWNIVACTATHKLGGDDSLQFTISGEIDAGTFAPFAAVVLRDWREVIRFSGTLTRSSHSAKGGSQSRSYTVEGANYWLTRVVYRQIWPFITSPGDWADIGTIKAALASDPTALLGYFSYEYTGEVILNRTNLGLAVLLSDQVKAVLDYAITQEGAPVGYDLTGLPGTIRPPQSQQVDLRVLDAIRNQLDWAPHLSWRWEYGEDVPVARFGDSTSGETFVMPGQGTAVRTLVLDGSNPFAVEFLGDPRWDLLVPGVEIRYIYGLSQVDPDDESTFFNVRQTHVDASPVIGNGSYGILRTTIALQGQIVNFVAGQKYTTTGEAVPPDGLAEALHRVYAAPYFELRFSTTAQEVDWGHGVGERFNVTGAGDQYETAEAIVQSIVRDLAAGTTSWQCGAPSDMNAQKRMALLQGNRLRKLGKDAAGQQNGLDNNGKTDPLPASAYNVSQDPWAVEVVPHDHGAGGESKLAVNPFSPIYGAGLSVLVSLSGVPASWPATSGDTTNFACPEVGDLIWVEITTFVGTSFDPTMGGGAIIKHGAPWTGYPDQIDIDAGPPAFQKYYRMPIAKIVPASDVRAGQACIASGGVNAKVLTLYNQGLIMVLEDRDTLICIVPAQPGTLWAPF